MIFQRAKLDMRSHRCWFTLKSRCDLRAEVARCAEARLRTG
jgi:hypothetical protein